MAYSNRTLAERYANGKTTGTSYSGSMFIEGNAIYSYGYHYTIAQRLKQGVYAINKMDYSVTTSKHRTYVVSALEDKGFTLIWLADCNTDKVIYTVKENDRAIQEMEGKLKRARTESSRAHYERMIDFYKTQNKLLTPYYNIKIAEAV